MKRQSDISFLLILEKVDRILSLSNHPVHIRIMPVKFIFGCYMTQQHFFAKNTDRSIRVILKLINLNNDSHLYILESSAFSAVQKICEVR